MRLKNVFLLLLCFAFFSIGCKNETKPNTTKNPSGTGTVTEKPEAVPNWTCVPGKQVGLITSSSTEGDIIYAYGKENVTRGEIGLGEGETTMATIVFPLSENELLIRWVEGQAYKKIESINIMNAGANWKTSQGITIGTTLEQLLSINKKSFNFTGFEWDYAGGVMDWNGGSIDKNLKITMEPTKEEAVFPDLLGDTIFSTDHPKAKEAGLRVASFKIVFQPEQ